MRSYVLYFLLCCVIFNFTSSKPLQIEENNSNESDEAEYGVLNAEASNVQDRDGDDAPAEREVSADQEEAVSNQEDPSENEYQPTDIGDQRRLRPNADIFTENKRNSEEIQTLSQHRQPNKRYERNQRDQDNQVMSDHELSNNEFNNPDMLPNNDAEVNKRTAILPNAINDEGALLFNRHDVGKIDNKYNNNEGLDTSEEAHFFKQYRNTMQTDNKRGLYDATNSNGQFTSRERREAGSRQQKNNPDTTSNDQQNSQSVDEETAIRNHIKKLSGAELKELYDSLSDEKRQLLKKIIDDTHVNFDAYDNINKREITKKAGALEENNLVENVQSELSKIQPSSSSAEDSTEASESTSIDATTLNKQTESLETSNANTDNKLDVTGTGELNKVKSDNLNSLTSVAEAKNQVSNIQEQIKSENKREINYNDLLNGDYSLENSRLVDNELDSGNSPESTFDQEYICAQEGDMAPLADDNNQKELYKREAYPNAFDNLSDSFKSLEESFPNSNAYNDPAPYNGALVRVKRKDHNMKKRSAGVLPHAKTGYFQYKSESEEADNDEGNEFDDDGFYDVTSNFAKNKPIEDASCDTSFSRPSATDSGNPLPSDNPILPSNDKVARDTVNLGSDTDSVISGVEGVDDNLMYSSSLRNKRNDDKFSSIEKLSPLHSTELVDNEIKTASEIYMSAPNYQENDAFGPLPRNSEGDLGRYKRIRRLKPSHDIEQESNPESAQ